MADGYNTRVSMRIENVERIYDSYSGIYDLLFKSLLQPGRRRAVSALRIEPGDRILEVGVGTGLSLPYYPPHCEITGIDISGEMLKHAEGRARELGLRGARFLRMGAERMDLPTAAFDRVLASYVLSTVSDPDRVLGELWRVCRPGGTVVILNHFRSSNRIVALGERALTPISRRIGFVLDLSLEGIMDGRSFDVESVERVNSPPLWSLVVMRRNGMTGGGNGDGPDR